MRFGGGNSCRPFGIVGQQQEAFAGFVEATDWGEPGKRLIQERVDGIASFFVGRGRDQAAGLVHHQVDLLWRGEDGVVDEDSVFFNSDWSFKVATDAPIQANASGA